MMRCWEANAQKRPQFAEITKIIEDYLANEMGYLSLYPNMTDNAADIQFHGNQCEWTFDEFSMKKSSPCKLRTLTKIVFLVSRSVALLHCNLLRCITLLIIQLCVSLCRIFLGLLLWQLSYLYCSNSNPQSSSPSCPYREDLQWLQPVLFPL